ncbi:hypothetical protein JST99_04110 [Candidatus Dependentiae bacterium]|nr:hypothetical protein [Candidatus Dependentiae bacterium]MCC7415395.1 hypothetical protein [Campylobacterota bacterium]
MKTEKNTYDANKKCTCSSIQQCDMHRKPRAERIEAQAQPEQSKKETGNKKHRSTR